MIPGIMAGLAVASSGGGTPVPDFANVVWLLNMGGADGSTTFTDSTGLRSWTPHGNVQVDDSLGYNAALFDGAGDYLDTPHASDLVLGSQDFCIEGFIRLPDVAPQQAIIEKRGTGFSVGDWAIFNTSGAIDIYSYDVNSAGSAILFANAGITNNTETHWAWTRSGNTMRLFIDGVLWDSITTSASIASSSVPLTIGQDSVSGGRFWLSGFIRACRGVIGEPVYTSNFTPPTAPFPTS